MDFFPCGGKVEVFTIFRVMTHHTSTRTRRIIPSNLLGGLTFESSKQILIYYLMKPTSSHDLVAHSCSNSPNLSTQFTRFLINHTNLTTRGLRRALTGLSSPGPVPSRGLKSEWTGPTTRNPTQLAHLRSSLGF